MTRLRWIDRVRAELGLRTTHLTKRRAVQALLVAAKCAENPKLRTDLIELASLISADPPNPPEPP